MSSRLQLSSNDTVTRSLHTKLVGGGGQKPGTVVLPEEGLLVTVLSILQEQRVLIVCGGPSWSYTGKVVVQEPLFTWYCRVEPGGHCTPGGAVITPPDTSQSSLQMLLTMLTLAGTGNTGQTGQAPGAVVTELVGLETSLFALQLHRVRIV